MKVFPQSTIVVAILDAKIEKKNHQKWHYFGLILTGYLLEKLGSQAHGYGRTFAPYTLVINLITKAIHLSRLCSNDNLAIGDRVKH